jgi:hypothetical protein
MMESFVISIMGLSVRNTGRDEKCSGPRDLGNDVGLVCIRPWLKDQPD